MSKVVALLGENSVILRQQVEGCDCFEGMEEEVM
jgi:hypothetical protein